MTFSFPDELNEIGVEVETPEINTPFLLIYTNFSQKENQLFYCFNIKLQLYRESPFQFLHLNDIITQSNYLVAEIR